MPKFTGPQNLPHIRCYSSVGTNDSGCRLLALRLFVVQAEGRLMNGSYQYKLRDYLVNCCLSAVTDMVEFVPVWLQMKFGNYRRYCYAVSYSPSEWSVTN